MARALSKRAALVIPVLAAGITLGVTQAAPAATSPAFAAGTTTAWQNGTFNVDTPNVVRRSDIVLGKANTDPTTFVPLGNGTLGAAVWAANGFTAQLNRSDTFPDRKSPGQVVIPGLSKLTGAADFHGFVDVYDGMLHESGGGMSLTAYVRSDTAQLVVDVTGADPNSSQTAQVKLWTGRSPSAQASGATATLAETFPDNSSLGASGQTFGSLAGIAAGARNVSASNPDGLTAQVAFNPNTDGSYRVIVAAPTWTGGNAINTANAVINGDTTKPASTIDAAHLAFWHNYWSNAGLVKITSSDGSGEYIENVRTLYLYFANAERGGPFPGSQAGVADLFNFSQDHQDWFPSGFWFWNLRMQVQANLSAGVANLNDPVFNLYASNVNNITSWTTSKDNGRAGTCVPETMRFNGNGFYNGGEGNASCDATISPSFNAETITSGAEIGLWVWQTFMANDDRNFLSTNYPVMRGAAQFLLASATTGSDGLLHTTENAHETQWNVTDPVTDIVAMQSLFPVVVKAAQTLGVDSGLVNQINAAIPKIPPLPRTDTASQTQILGPSADGAGNDMIALSTQPTATRHNSENLGLESVFPYNLIGDNSPMTALAKRTYTSRSYVNAGDWTFDSLQAARLGLSSEVQNDLIAATSRYQVYPSGLANLGGSKGDEPYVEQSGVASAAVSEALVQDYDGLLRITPAWPSNWSGAGTVSIQHNTKVDVQISNGTPSTVAIVSGSNTPINIRSPWPGQAVTVVDGSSGATVVGSQTNATFSIPVQAGKSYLVELTSSPTTGLPFASISGSAATAAKHLGSQTIGLDGTGTSGGHVISLRAHANNMIVTADNAGASPLIANRTAIGTWEQFDEIDLGNGNIALRAHANNMIVTAENAGASPLIANRTAVGAWETFALIHNGDGSISLRAMANGNIVTADNAGASPLIANRTAIGPWEEFDLIND